MSMMTAVIETPVLEPLPNWPVAEIPPFSWLRLWKGSSDEEVGLFMYVLCTYGNHEEVDGNPTVTEILQEVVERECLILPGGLLVQQDHSIIHPGCCSGLEDWRDWYGVPEGQFPWLGHDPWPWVEIVDGVVRVWANQDSLVHVNMDIEQFMLELESVSQDLQHFLKRCADWIARSDERQVNGLLEKIAQDFSIDL